MIQHSIPQEDITILNVSGANNRVSTSQEAKFDSTERRYRQVRS